MPTEQAFKLTKLEMLLLGISAEILEVDDDGNIYAATKMLIIGHNNYMNKYIATGMTAAEYKSFAKELK